MQIPKAPGLLLFLAARNLLESRTSSLLLLAAVAAGVGFQLPNTANLNGYESELLEQGLSQGFGDVRIRARSGRRLEDADALAARISALPGVVAAVPVLAVPGAIGSGGRFSGVVVSGTDALASRHPFQLAEGALPAAGDKSGIVVGTAQAARLGLRVGDPLQLRLVYGPAGEALEGDNVGRFTMTVRGLAQGSFGACGTEAALVDRGFLGGELGRPGAADQLLVYGSDHGAARALAERLRAELPALEVRPWMDDSAFLESAVQASKAVAGISLAMVVFAVVIPVWALLYIHVLHRQRQVGMLRALGLSGGDVFAVFLLQALLVGLCGVLLGLGLGFALVAWFQGHPIFHMDGFVLRPLLTAPAVLWPAATVLCATLLAGVVPALRAARIDPGRALRGEE